MIISSKNLCYRCIGESYLKAEVKREGKGKTCSYCGRKAKSYTIAELSDRVEEAFNDHYIRTSDQPNSWQISMLSDKESDYDWERDGEPVVYAIMNACDIPEKAAVDIQQVLEERHFDIESAKCGEETDFSSDSYYEEKKHDTSYWQEKWNNFENSLRTEARFFSRSAVTLLESIFGGIENLRTHDGRALVAKAGPNTAISEVYRARAFQSSDKLKEALKYPDQHIGPPPTEYALAGRMNAHGISVFYGANDPLAALAEVRPPVGSRVVVGRFEIVKPIKLLDLTALSTAIESGSIFDSTLKNRLERAMFLRKLSQRITIPVMPYEEPFRYLATQAIADFLATEANFPLDGIIYPSVQVADGRLNIALFQKAARVEKIAIPEGTEVEANLGYWDEDYWEHDFSVIEKTIGDEERNQKKEAEIGSFLIEHHLSGYDSRPVTLRMDVNSLEVHIIRAVNFSSNVHTVRRHRWQKREVPF
jgi:hypothetical protein